MFFLSLTHSLSRLFVPTIHTHTGCAPGSSRASDPNKYSPPFIVFDEYDVCVCVCIAHAIFTSEAIPTSRKLNGRNRYLIIVVVIIIIMEQLVRARDTADNLVVGWLVVACRESS